MMKDLVTTDDLAGELGAPDLVILDASMAPPGSIADMRAQYEHQHIPGARFFDVVAMKKDPDFAAAMEHLGVGGGDRIIVYDHSPVRSATRAWWQLQHYGAKHVAVLDGGLAKWIAEGRPVESGPAIAREAAFAGRPSEGRHVTKADILAGLTTPLVDARDAKRFSGESSDPRPGVSDGHIPGARNLPYGALYKADGTLRPPEELRAAFAAAGIDPLQPFAASCGSGVTATSLLFAARLLGNDLAKLYEGSWTEWGSDPATAKELGPPRG
jgi:thiosulfate/3-mercaptopyruvate sulfurtransferase